MCFLGTEIQIEYREDVAVVAVSGCIVGDAFDQLRSSIERAITRTKSFWLVLDLSQVLVVNMKCLNGLVSLFRKARVRGGRMTFVVRGLELVDTKAYILNLISIIQFHHHLRVSSFYKSKEEALQSFANG